MDSFLTEVISIGIPFGKERRVPGLGIAVMDSGV